MALRSRESGTPTLLYEPADAGRALSLTSASVQALADSGRLRIVARTPRGMRLFDPADVDALRVSRAAVKAGAAP